MASGAHVDLRIRAGYALVSWAGATGALRLTARYDRFRNDDRDGVAEPNDESGWAITLAAFYAPRPWLRLGAEYLDLRADRPAAAFAGTALEAGARRAQAEVRLRF
jgi:phosphate-selective porin